MAKVQLSRLAALVVEDNLGLLVVFLEATTATRNGKYESKSM